MSQDFARSRLRGAWKAAVLVLSLCQCVLNFLFLRALGNHSIERRALWLHHSCKMVLRRLGFEIQYAGALPARGLIASNHLSYLDVLFYGAAVPCVFVSKTEVRGWPLLGLLAALGGTVFLDRGSAASTAKAALQIQELLEAGILVLVFPEGTSSDGAEILRFHASLFQPAVAAGLPVTAAAISYTACAGATEKDFCYYGDISFAPHLLKTLRLPEVAVRISFAPGVQAFTHRKSAAALTREAVIGLRSGQRLAIGVEKPESSTGNVCEPSRSSCWE